MDDMNDSDSWAQAFTYREWLMSDIDFKDLESWAQGSKCFE